MRVTPSTDPDLIRVENPTISGVGSSGLGSSGIVSCKRYMEGPEPGGSKREKDPVTCNDLDGCRSLPKSERRLDPTMTGSICVSVMVSAWFCEDSTIVEKERGSSVLEAI